MSAPRLPGGRKFCIGVGGLIIVLVTALTKTMDGNVVAGLTVVVGGFFGADTAITRKALHEGAETNPNAGDV